MALEPAKLPIGTPVTKLVSAKDLAKTLIDLSALVPVGGAAVGAIRIGTRGLQLSKGVGPLLRRVRQMVAMRKAGRPETAKRIANLVRDEVERSGSGALPDLDKLFKRLSKTRALRPTRLLPPRPVAVKMVSQINQQRIAEALRQTRLKKGMLIE